MLHVGVEWMKTSGVFGDVRVVPPPKVTGGGPDPVSKIDVAMWAALPPNSVFRFPCVFNVKWFMFRAKVRVIMACFRDFGMLRRFRSWLPEQTLLSFFDSSNVWKSVSRGNQVKFGPFTWTMKSRMMLLLLPVSCGCHRFVSWLWII